MQLIFSDQSLPLAQTKSIFLAGPSPRSPETADWRPAALAELQRLGFDGTVLIPIPKARFEGAGVDAQGWTYSGQVEWETSARALADIILFWIPRVLDVTRRDLGMPAFTTNFEMGEDLASAKVVYGRPTGAPKMSYLDQKAAEKGLQIHETLPAALSEAVQRLGEGAYRQGGEAEVPLFIWRTPAFQGWYLNLKAAGNRLDGARVLGQVAVGHGFLFCFLLKVRVWVAAEQRHKSNEFIVARPDTSAVLAVHRGIGPKGPAIHVVLVREFRSTVNNAEGYVYELPAGSSTKPGLSPKVNAMEEFSEETGLVITDVNRFKRVGLRQLAATLSVHRAELYAIELSDAEFGRLQKAADSGRVFGEGASGDGASGERTYVVLTTVADIFKLPVDYATLGMLVEGLRTLFPLRWEIPEEHS